MATTCTIKDAAEKTLATGTLLSRNKTDCNVLLTDFTTKIHLPVPEQPVMLHIASSTYGIQLYSAITESHTYSTVSFTNMQLLKTIQRRSDVKIKIHAQLSIFPTIYQDEGGAKKPVPDLTHEIAIDLADISASGAGFYCNEELDESKFYFLHMPLTDQCIELMFVVVRSVEHTRGRRFYGCRLHQIPPPVESALRCYIYQRGLFQG